MLRCTDLPLRQGKRLIHLGGSLCGEEKTKFHFPHSYAAPFKILQRFDEVTKKNFNTKDVLTNVPRSAEFSGVRDELESGAMFPGFLSLFAIKRKPKLSLKFQLIFARRVSGIDLKESDAVDGSRFVFEKMFHNMSKDSVETLRNPEAYCDEVIDDVHKSICDLQPSQLEVFNITSDDIVDFRTYNEETFRSIKRGVYNDRKCLAYNVVWHAFYKRKLLDLAVKDIEIHSGEGPCKQAVMPKDYGFAYPRFISANMTFLHFVDDDSAVLRDFLYTTN